MFGVTFNGPADYNVIMEFRPEIHPHWIVLETTDNPQTFTYSPYIPLEILTLLV